MIISQILILTAIIPHFVLCQGDKFSEVVTSVKWVPIEGIISKSLKTLKNSHGKNIYIGRTTFIGGTIPGVVFYTMSEVYFTFKGQVFKKPDFELLVDPKEELVWVPVSGKISDPFIAGHDPEDSIALYVCRVVENDQFYKIGKVSSALEICTLTSDGVIVQHFADYEVLVKSQTRDASLQTIEEHNINHPKVLSEPLDKSSLAIVVTITTSAVLVVAGAGIVSVWFYRRKRLQRSSLPVPTTEEDLLDKCPIKN